MATVMPLAISPNSMKRSIAWKPTRISSQTDSTGENSTANCERWLKIARCGYDLQRLLAEQGFFLTPAGQQD
jgi:hypothetical protein